MKRTDVFGLVMLIVSLVIAVASITALIISSRGFEPENRKPSLDYFERGWEGDYSLSYDITELTKRGVEFSTDKPFVLTKTVPEVKDGYSSLIFTTYNLVVNVYLDNELVSFVNENGYYADMVSFSDVRVVDFDSSDSGKKIKLEIFSTPYSFNCMIGEMYFGSSYDYFISGFPSISLLVACTVAFFVAGVAFICLGIATRKTLEHYRGMIYYGLFSVFISIWFLSGSTYTRTFITNHYLLNNCCWLLISVSMMFLLLYIYDSFKVAHLGFYQVVLVLSAALAAILTALLFTGIIPIIYTVFVQFIFILFVIVAVIVEMITYLTHNSGNKKFSRCPNIGIVSFGIFVFYDMCRFYQNSSGDLSAATRIGYIILTITAGCGMAKEAIELLKLGITAGRIGKIAYTDANTGIGNAAAFKMRMEELEHTKTNYNYIGIIQFDVNNLKIINDTKGHEAGDLLIKTAADIIDKSFGTIGDCYRTGGDEFVAITTYNHAPLVCEDAIYRFDSLISQFDKNPERPFDLRIAYGVAYYINGDNRFMTLSEVHRIADERMYNNKKELKARYAKTPEEAVIR